MISGELADRVSAVIDRIVIHNYVKAEELARHLYEQNVDDFSQLPQDLQDLVTGAEANTLAPEHDWLIAQALKQVEGMGENAIDHLDLATILPVSQ